MKVICCRCGKPYEYEHGVGVIKKTVDLGEGNAVDIIECPHCGLQHTIVWTKRVPKEVWKESEN